MRAPSCNHSNTTHCLLKTLGRYCVVDDSDEAVAELVCIVVVVLQIEREEICAVASFGFVGSIC